MASIGSSVREISAFLWSEVAIVLAGGLALAALLGWLLAEMLVAMLRHVFDRRPLTWPRRGSFSWVLPCQPCWARC